MSGNRRGNLLNPHGRHTRLSNYYNLPITIPIGKIPKNIPLTHIFTKGKDFFSSVFTGLCSFFFPKAEINNLPIHKSLFEMLNTSPISKPPQSTNEHTNDISNNINLKRPPSQDINNIKKKPKIIYHNAGAQTDIPYNSNINNFKGQFFQFSKKKNEKNNCEIIED